MAFTPKLNDSAFCKADTSQPASNYCPRQDLNLQGNYSHQHLKLARLPVPPPGRAEMIVSENLPSSRNFNGLQ